MTKSSQKLLTRRSHVFPKEKQHLEMTYALRGASRREQRRRLVLSWLKEQPYSSYRYNVEDCKDGTWIYLRRPTNLNKGFDFQVHLEGFRSRRRRPPLKSGRRRPRTERPSHQDVINELRLLTAMQPKLRTSIFGAICDVYECREPFRVLKRRPELRNLTARLSMLKVLLIIKWLFVEQDLTYWLGKGRDRLMRKIEKEVFRIRSRSE